MRPVPDAPQGHCQILDSQHQRATTVKRDCGEVQADPSLKGAAPPCPVASACCACSRCSQALCTDSQVGQVEELLYQLQNRGRGLNPGAWLTTAGRTPNLHAQLTREQPCSICAPHSAQALTTPCAHAMTAASQVAPPAPTPGTKQKKEVKTTPPAARRQDAGEGAEDIKSTHRTHSTQGTQVTGCSQSHFLEVCRACGGGRMAAVKQAVPATGLPGMYIPGEECMAAYTIWTQPMHACSLAWEHIKIRPRCLKALHRETFAPDICGSP